jgi:hypothetical protein
MRFHLLMVPFLVVLPVGCKCGNTISRVPPTLKVSPVAVPFGAVKVSTSAQATLKLDAQSNSAVTISAVTLANGGEPGGAEGFKVVKKPSTVPGLDTEKLEISFSPLAVQAYEAVLSVESDDPDHPAITVLLTGEGKEAQIAVTPECPASRKCVGTVVVTPPSIDFGAEPFVRLLPVDVSALPSINIVNEGLVELNISKISVGGADAAAFTIQGNSTVPAGGLLLGPAEGRSISIRFKPTSEAQQSYAAVVVIESDDPAHNSVKVELKGTLRGNLPPQVCANLIRIKPIDDAQRDFGTKADWAPLLVAPAGGYDFTRTRDVEPRALTTFSALSDPDEKQCTTDPEDGRAGLTFRWELVTAPAGAMSLGISNATSAQASLTPIVSGEYVLKLTVNDTQSHSTAVLIRFAVAVKQDLVAQLQWTGFNNVDLDVHLVRPSAVTAADPFSGAFAFFEAGDAGRTAGDINGYALIKQRPIGSGFDFDWGNAGTSDDPRLNIDDIGDGQLLENVSLNYPEHDPKCATAGCTYKVFVHYYKDGRSSAGSACTVDGGTDCLDGLACGCAAPSRCVADSAPIGAAAFGVGKCYEPPKPVVRIFLKGNPVPAATVPLDTLVPPDNLALGAPCQMLYVADVVWPAQTAIGSLADGGTPLANIAVRGAPDGGRVTPELARFGFRPAGGSLQCSPDTTKGASVAWYTQQP